MSDLYYYDPYDVEINTDPYPVFRRQRFPEREVDVAAAKLSPTSTVRGWETLPVRTP